MIEFERSGPDEELPADELRSDLCYEVVAYRDNEPLLRNLFTEHDCGAWVPLAKLSADAQIQLPSDPGDLQVSYLQHPSGDASLRIVLFFDENDVWSFTAVYNHERLMNGD